MSDSDQEVISLDDSDDEDIPDRETCQKLTEEFAKVTGTDEACAQFFLQDRQWNLERSVNAYFEAKKGGIKVLDDGDSSEVVVTFDSQMVSALEDAKAEISHIPPNNFRLLTWNIDGLDHRNLQRRIKSIVQTIKKEKADIVFLQELVPSTYKYIEDSLPEFMCIAAGNAEYFCGTLLRRTTVYFDGHTILPFKNSTMGRNALCVEAHIGDALMYLINTHLESTGEFAKERMEQLKMMFAKLVSKTNATSILAGDMNLRDSEVDEVGLPGNVADLWEFCGKREACKYTWDTQRNSNLEMAGRFKPRKRFDRVYLHNNAKSKIKPVHFGLIGLEKVKGTQSFPSDHWGILVHFEVSDLGQQS